MQQRARIRLIVIYIAAAILFLGTVGPFLWLVSSSFQYERQLLNIPPQWLPNPVVLDSYREIFEGAVLGEASGVPYQSRIFLRSFANSFFVAGSVAAIAVLVGAYAAYPLARLQFPRAQRLAIRHPSQPPYSRPLFGDPDCSRRQENRHERQDRLTGLYQSLLHPALRHLAAAILLQEHPDGIGRRWPHRWLQSPASCS